MRSHTLERITLFGVLLLILAVAVVVTTPPADGYEISIYDAYPMYMWLSVFGALLVGAIVTILSARTPTDRTWVFSLALMLMTNVLLLLIPYIRGYQMYGRADPMTHIGFLIDIYNSGSTAGNIYPPTHLLTLGLVEVTGTTPATVAMLVPVVFSVLYFAAMCYVLIQLFDSREQVLMGLPFVLLPVLATRHLNGFRPYDLAVMLVPLVLYLFIKSQRAPAAPIRVALVIALLALLFYHPLTAMFIIGIFVLYHLAKHAPAISERQATPTSVFSLSTAVFLGWYSLFTGIILRFDEIYVTLFGPEAGEAPLGQYTQTVSETSPALIDILRIVAFKYGLAFMLFGLGFLFLGIVTWLALRGRHILDTYTSVFVGIMGVFSFGGLFFLVTDLLVPPERPFMIAKIGAVILAGRLYYFIIKEVDWSSRRPSLRFGSGAFLAGFLALIIALSVFSFYPAPFGSETNNHVTEMEVEGTEWLVETGNPSTQPVEFGIKYRRFTDAQYGARTVSLGRGTGPPSHFNYTEYRYLGASYDDDRYLTITRKGRLLYPEVFPGYPENWRFTPADFERLERDRTTARIYDNSDYTQYRVTGTRNVSA